MEIALFVMFCLFVFFFLSSFWWKLYGWMKNVQFTAKTTEKIWNQKKTTTSGTVRIEIFYDLKSENAEK